MKYIYKLQIILLSLSILLFTSCSKKKEMIKTPPDAEQGSDLLSIIESYYKFSTIKPDGKLMFESNLCNNDPSLTNIALVGGVLYDKQGNVEIGGSPISIGDYLLSPNTKGTYGFDKMLPQTGLFGTNVTFSVNNRNTNNTNNTKPNNGQSVATATLYSPKAIIITNVAPRTPINIVPIQTTIVNWNTDVNNPNGVIIIGEYIPTRYMNKKSLTAGYSKLIESSLKVPDNGSTSIPWSFFSKFPEGGHIILWVARGNYSILSNGKYLYQVGGYTAAAVWDVIMPIIPPVIRVNNYASVSGFKATYTNTATSLSTTFNLSTTSGTVGTLAKGTYNVSILKIGNSTKYNFQVCDDILKNNVTSATFNNIVVSGDCDINISINGQPIP